MDHPFATRLGQLTRPHRRIFLSSRFIKVISVALLGDAGENVCPSTGMGLTKIFTDVDVLSTYVSSWFGTSGMGAEKIASYFDHPSKRTVDTRALQNAFYRRQASTGRSLRWRIHRTRLHISMRLKKPSMIVFGRA